MNRTPRTQSRLAVLTAALFAVVLAFASPAFAHDELVDSNPAADAALAEAPTEVVLEYSSDLLDLGEASTVVMVMDAAEKDWLAGPPVLDRKVLTAPLEPGMPDGAYEIRWQVISSDGHPITGIVPFTVGDVAPVAETQEPAATPTPEATEESKGMPQPLRIILLGLGGAALAFALFFLSLQAIRRGKDEAQQ